MDKPVVVVGDGQSKTRADELRALLDVRRQAILTDIVQNNPALKVMSGLAGEATVKKLLTKRISGSKYTPHQGAKEKFRRAYRIAKTHPVECQCETCQYVVVASGAH